jgi:predicted phage terminase large subunit-like protein
VVDDLENDELVANKERRVKLERWFFGSVLPALSDNGRLIIIGTILHYDSLLNKLSKNPEFNTLFYRAVMNETPLWEAKYSLDDLAKIKESYRSQGMIDVFFCEFMNEPLSDENAIFKKSYFKYYSDDEPLIKSLAKFLTVDLAISEKESADYTVLMVTGIDALNQIYILEYVRERMNPIETLEMFFKLAKKWNIQRAGIESVAYQRALQWFIEEEMRKRNEYYMIQELKADTDKERRIRGLQPRYALGTVYHKAHMTELEEELLLFPKSAHDDLSDALAYVPQIAFPGTSISQLNENKPTGRQEAVMNTGEINYDNY